MKNTPTKVTCCEVNLYRPGEEVDAEEDVFTVVEVELVSCDHNFSHGVRRGAQDHN